MTTPSLHDTTASDAADFGQAASQLTFSHRLELEKLKGIKETHRIPLLSKLLTGIAMVTTGDLNNETALIQCANSENHERAKRLLQDFMTQFGLVKQQHDGKKDRVDELYSRITELRIKHGLKAEPEITVPGFLRDVKPRPRTALSAGQVPLLDSLENDGVNIVAILGHFGSGKTYLSVAQALDDIVSGRKRKLIATRKESPVHKQIGFVPGSQHDKTKRDNHAVFENIVKVFMDWGVPEKEAISKAEMLVKPSKGLLPGQEIVEVVLPAQLEGRTIHDAVIILDEAHGVPTSVMRGILGRLGDNSKLIIIGDFHQINDKRLRQTHFDEDDGCGLAYAVSLLANSPNIDNVSMIISMNAEDVHRSAATREVATAMQTYAQARGLFPVWQADIDRALRGYQQRKAAKPAQRPRNPRSAAPARAPRHQRG